MLFFPSHRFSMLEKKGEKLAEGPIIYREELEYYYVPCPFLLSEINGEPLTLK